MKELANYVLAFYALANAGIILWFFVIRPKQIDKKYDEMMENIYEHHPKRNRTRL